MVHIAVYCFNIYICFNIATVISNTLLLLYLKFYKVKTLNFWKNNRMSSHHFETVSGHYYSLCCFVGYSNTLVLIQ